MPVRWALADPSVMGHVEHLVAGKLEFGVSSSDMSSIVASFRTLPFRHLVVTGPAGSGKTTFAVQLLRELLRDLTDDAPVPVLLSLADWDPMLTPRMADWLEKRLLRDYPGLRDFGRDAALALSEQGRVLPILDGLDEIDEDDRLGVLKSISRSAGGLPGYVLTCREPELRRIIGETRALSTAVVIVSQPIKPREASEYLRLQLPSGRIDVWTKFLDDLSAGNLPPHVEQACRTPLSLWLITEVYAAEGKDPTTFIKSAYTADGLSHRGLVSELTRAVIRNRPPVQRRDRRPVEQLSRPRHTYAAAAVEKMLTALAADLRSRGTQDWIWWNYGATVFNGRYSRVTFKMLLFAMLFVAFALLELGFMLALDFVSLGSSFLSFAFTVSAVCCLPAFLSRRVSRAPTPPDLRLRGRGRVLGYSALVGFLLTAIVTAALVGIFGASGRAGQSFEAVLPASAVVFVALTAFLFAGRRTSPTPIESPYLGYRAAQIELLIHVAFVEISIAAVFFVSGVWNLWIAFLLSQAILPVVIARSPITAYWLAVIVSKMTRSGKRVPLRRLVFIEDIHRLGLLRTVGSAYQFRHAELQDYFSPPIDRDTKPRTEGRRLSLLPAQLNLLPSKSGRLRSRWIAVGLLLAALGGVLAVLGVNNFFAPISARFDSNYKSLVLRLPAEVESCQRSNYRRSYLPYLGHAVQSLSEADCDVKSFSNTEDRPLVDFNLWRSSGESRISILRWGNGSIVPGECGSLPSGSKKKYGLWTIDGHSGVIACSLDSYRISIDWTRDDLPISVHIFDAPMQTDATSLEKRYIELVKGSYALVAHLT